MSRNIVRPLRCTLTEEEVNDRGRTVAQLTEALFDAERSLEREKEASKNAVKEAEAIVLGRKAELSAAARVVREREELRPVECVETMHRAERRCVVTRMDTGEVIERRPLSDDDARKGAEWSRDHHAGRATLRHPEEPGVVLDARPLTDDEKQLEVPGTEKEPVKATSKRKSNGASGDEAAAK